VYVNCVKHLPAVLAGQRQAEITLHGPTLNAYTFFFFFFFFFFKSSTYIAVYSKQSARYSKLHLFIPDGHEEDSEFARITLRVGVDGSVNHRHVNMRGR